MAGKGSRARNNYSKEFRENYEAIDWGHSKPLPSGLTFYLNFKYGSDNQVTESIVLNKLK